LILRPFAVYCFFVAARSVGGPAQEHRLALLLGQQVGKERPPLHDAADAAVMAVDEDMAPEQLSLWSAVLHVGDEAGNAGVDVRHVFPTELARFNAVADALLF